MDQSEIAKSSLTMMAEQANLLANVATHPKATKLAQKALGCSVEGLKAHSKGDVVGASMHASYAATHLTNAAKLHVSTLDDFPEPQMLDLAHLGKAHSMHQDYVDAINEGKKNGS
jgi:hypothetical protein